MWQKVSAGLYAFGQSGTCSPNSLVISVSKDWDNYKMNGTVPCPKGTIPGLDGKLDHKLHSSDPVSDCPSSPGNDGFGKNNVNKFIELVHNVEVPAILSIGGNALSIALLDTMKIAPATFIESAIDFVNQSGFDGVDINLVPYNNDWTKMSDDEISSFVSFLKDLKTAMPEGKLVTASMPFSGEAVLKIGQGNMQLLHSTLDHIFLMEYDMHDAHSTSKISNFQVPFKYDKNQPENVEGRKDFNVVNIGRCLSQRWC